MENDNKKAFYDRLQSLMQRATPEQRAEMSKKTVDFLKTTNEDLVDPKKAYDTLRGDIPAESKGQLKNVIKKMNLEKSGMLDPAVKITNIPNAMNTAKSVAKTAGKKLLGALPVVGAIGSYLQSGDAAAAVADEAVPGGVDDIGPRRGTPEEIFENPSSSKEDRMKAYQQLTGETGEDEELKRMKMVADARRRGEL